MAYILEQVSGLKLSRGTQIEFGRIVQKLADEVGRELSPQEIWGCFERECEYELDSCALPEKGCTKLLMDNHQEIIETTAL